MKMLEEYNFLPELPVGGFQAFDITPAAKWFLQENDKEEYDVAEDFHRIVPPYPQTWLEFEHPNSTFSLQAGRNFIEPHRQGMLAITLEVNEDFTREVVGRIEKGEHVLLDFFKKLTNSAIDYAYAPDYSRLIERIKKGSSVRWFSLWSAWTTLPLVCKATGLKPSPWVSRLGFIDQDGRAMPNDAIVPTVLSYVHPLSRQMVAAEDISEMGSAFLPFAFALQLLHCKNVVPVDVVLPDKVRAKRARAEKNDIRYKMLTIDSFKKAARYKDDNGNRASVKRALHFARGHFKDFSHGDGLFGKYRGIYWWHDQARGDINSGAVDKDYKVKHRASIHI